MVATQHRSSELTAVLVFVAATAVVVVSGHAALTSIAPPAKVTLPVISWTPRADWVNVKDLGAKGDGKSDDTAAITTALGKLTNSDYGKPLNTDVKTVYFPPGT
jgi:hypothetical protein